MFPWNGSPGSQGSTSGGGGSGGDASASVEVYTEVATLAALLAARANGARLLVTNDIAMSLTDTIDLTSYTSLTIAIQDGKKVSHSGTANIFSASSGTCRLTLETGARSPLAPAFEVTGTGKIADSSGVLILDWSKRLHIDGPSGAWTPFGTGVKLDGDGLVVDCGNGLVTIGHGYGRIKSLIANGGGSSCAVLLKVGCGPVTYRGQFRSYAGSMNSHYALSVQTAFNPTMSPVGPIQFDTTGQTYTPSVLASGLVSLTGVHGTDNSYVPRVGLADHSRCLNSRIVPVWVNTGYSGSFSQCYFQGGLFESSAKCGDIQSCTFAVATTTTFPSGSKPRIVGGLIHGTTVFQSGSEPIVQAVNVVGTITINSGANGRFTALQDGSGTLTNSDPLSVVTLSENVAWDTTPATRRWVDSSGNPLPELNALLPYLVCYFDFKEEPSPSKAPFGQPSTASWDGSISLSSDGVDGKGLNFAGSGDNVLVPVRFSPLGSAEYTVALFYKPVDATPLGACTVVSLTDGASSAGEWDLNHLSSGILSFWNGGGSTDGLTALTNGVASHVAFRKRRVSGTPTYEMLLDAVLEASTTGNASTAPNVNSVLHVGDYGGNPSNPGVYSVLCAFSCALADARIAEMAAGARLIGAGL